MFARRPGRWQRRIGRHQWKCDRRPGFATAIRHAQAIGVGDAASVGPGIGAGDAASIGLRNAPAIGARDAASIRVGAIVAVAAPAGATIAGASANTAGGGAINSGRPAFAKRVDSPTVAQAKHPPPKRPSDQRNYPATKVPPIAHTIGQLPAVSVFDLLS